MAREHSWISADQVWGLIRGAGCSLITNNKKILRIFVISLLLVSILYGYIAHDSRKGTDLYFNSVNYVYQPKVQRLQNAFNWYTKKGIPFIQEHFSITFSVEEWLQTKILW